MNNETFGQLIRKMRKSRGLSQQALAEKAHVSQATIARVERDEQKNLLEKTKNNLLRALGIKADSLPLTKKKPIPVISWVHAGLFTESSDVWPVGVSGEGDPVISYVQTGPNAFGLRIEGDSMLPRFMPGDVAIVDPAAPCDNGSPCVVWLNGEASLRLFWDRGTEIVLKSMNSKYKEVKIKKDNKTDFRVIGRVVDIKAKL